MSERLKNLLESMLPTYQYQMPAGLDAAITYQPYYAEDDDYESGRAVTEAVSYRVTVFQRVNNNDLIDSIVRALRNDGWTITSREWLIDIDNKYYQHSIDIDNWEVIK